MYKISNDAMLKFFQANMNEAKFLYTCTDIAKAGDANHIVRKIEFYTAEENKPDLEYVEFSENIDNELRIYIASDSFIEAVCKKILEIYDLYENVSVSTPNADLVANNVILKYFDISDISIARNGDGSIYALLSNEKLPHLIIPDKVEISPASLEQMEQLKNLNDDEWQGLPRSLNRWWDYYTGDSTLLFLLHYDNVLAGYLDANCRYKNFYDIAYIFVQDKFRGKDFGVLLTTYFAHHCLNNGFIPHYGTSASKYSANVAIKSGFEESERRHSFTISIK